MDPLLSCLIMIFAWIVLIATDFFLSHREAARDRRASPKPRPRRSSLAASVRHRDI